MTTFIYKGFQSVSEFSTAKDGDHRNGDCFWAALLPALNCIDSARWPLTADALDRLVEDASAKGCLMNPNGETNIPLGSKYLTAIGIPHRTVDYAQFTLDKLHADLKALANSTPGGIVLPEWSKAGAGLPDDEDFVQYHFSCFGGIDTDRGYFRADGDSNTDHRDGSPTPPILTSWTQIVAAAPIGYIVIDVQGASSMAVPDGWKDDGKVLTAPNGKPVDGHIREYVLNHNPQWPAHLMPMAPDYTVDASDWHQDFALTVYWNGAKNSQGEIAPPEFADQLAAVKQQLATANATIAQLQQQLANLSTETQVGKEVEAIEALLTNKSSS